MQRPSTPLLNFLRETIRKQGLTTAELADKTGLDRSTLKKRLSGAEALTVDDLTLLAQALKLEGADAVMPSLSVAEPEGEVDTSPDPTGNLPEQVLRLGFALGLDLLMILDVSQLAESGVPNSTLSRFAELLPIRLDPRYHRHNKPVFDEHEFRCVLSFDRLYTCQFPWTAFRQVNFVLPVEAPVEPPPEPPKPAASKAPFLRVIK